MKYLEDIDLTRPEFGEFYDELPLWSAPFGLLLLDRVPLRPGLTILDVGAGTGFLTLELAQRCGPSATVIAVDPWTSAVTRLRRKVTNLGLTNVRVLEQDAAALDLPDASVDLIVSNLGVNNFENAEAVLRTCHRVATPSARLVLTSNLVGHMAEFYEIYRTTLIDLDHRDLLGALEAHIGHRATRESITGLLDRTGFSAQDVVTDSFRMRFADGSSLLRHYFIRFGFLPAWKTLVPVASRDAFFGELERRLNQTAQAGGELALTIPMICVLACRA